MPLHPKLRGATLGRSPHRSLEFVRRRSPRTKLMHRIRLVLLPVLVLLPLGGHAAMLPAGTDLVVRLDTQVSSRTAQVGDIVPCSLARDLVVDGRTLAREGAPLRARVTYARPSGRFHKPGYLTIRLSSIEIDGRHYRLHSTAIRDKGNGHLRSNLEKIGGGTGLGAILGAIAGGGKGALIGSLAGAGAGTGLAAATGKQPATLPDESVHIFRLTRTAHPRR